ncbi:transcriptional regulator GcvA [Arenibaculum sp.]|jgi:LysR family glycine cleavage system transcriptional activator|uniref:transcriptional regulator GcvA n=1 Tax=Arenibaculum sp. TaxID=2865862 RepID=UPI002E143681|nr:transcriptional regulator GcvA [Arenibaculum sp.]
MAGKRVRLPSLNGLRAFEASARHLNFRLAAEELGVTQGAVAQQVRGLEADLGIRLFDRLPRSLALTATGRAYVANIRRAFELISEATATLRPRPSQVTISVTPTFASKWLIPRLPEFSREHPALELRIVASEGLADFRSDGVDVAVRQGHPPFGPGLAVDPLFEHEVVAVCSPSLIRDRGRPLTADDLGDLVLLHDAHDLWPQFVDHVLGTDRFPSGRGQRFSQTLLAIDAAVAGQGLAVASRFLVEQDLEAGRLVLAFDGSMRGGTDFYVVAPRKPRDPAATASVRAWLLDRRSR